MNRIHLVWYLKKNLNAPRPSEHPLPSSEGGKKVKTFRSDHRLQRQISSWHLNGFPDGSNIGRTDLRTAYLVHFRGFETESECSSLCHVALRGCCRRNRNVWTPRPSLPPGEIILASQGFVETQRLIVKKGGKFVGDAKVIEKKTVVVCSEVA